MKNYIRKFYDVDAGSAIMGGLGGAAQGFATGGPAGAAIGLGLGLLPTINGLLTAGKQRRLAKAIKDSDPTYQISPYAQAQLAAARNAYNGRMAGAGNLEQNIYQNQANTLGSVGRNATDSSQLLALAGATQGNTNNAFNNLSMDEAQNHQSMLGNLNQANAMMANETDKVYQDQLRKHQEAMGAKTQLGQASQTNKANAFNNLANMGTMAAGGVYGNPFGGFGAPSQPMGSPMRLDTSIPFSSTPQIQPFNIGLGFGG